MTSKIKVSAGTAGGAGAGKAICENCYSFKFFGKSIDSDRGVFYDPNSLGPGQHIKVLSYCIEYMGH